MYKDIRKKRDFKVRQVKHKLDIEVFPCQQ
jgi:hypothetical protein